MLRILWIMALLVTVGCNSSSQTEAAEPAGEAEQGAEAPSGPTVTATLEDGSRLFGAEMSEEQALTPLADLLARPAEFNGQTVKTEGVISQVCQRMGCWMELRVDAEGSAGVRVPMAGHSFFLPHDVAGRRAVVQGELTMTELPADHQEHLREEGAELATVNVQIEATGVIVR